MAYFPFESFLAVWEFLTRETYFSILKSNVNLRKNPAISLKLYRMDFVLVLFLYLSDWLKSEAYMGLYASIKIYYENKDENLP